MEVRKPRNEEQFHVLKAEIVEHEQVQVRTEKAEFLFAFIVLVFSFLLQVPKIFEVSDPGDRSSSREEEEVVEEVVEEVIEEAVVDEVSRRRRRSKKLS